MAKKPQDPFDVKISPTQRATLAHWLCRELQAGLDARATAEVEVDYWHALYEQARTRTGRSTPWPDAADLTSYLAAEKVDAMHARAMRTIWTDPIWTVDGWGEAADRAPFVEEFHQYKAEEERLQAVLDKWWLTALIEPRGLLEVSEGSEMRTTRKHLNAALKTDPLTGGIVYDDQGQPQLARDAQNLLVEATQEQPAAETVIDDTNRVRIGPTYRVIPYRDSVILPGHARDKQDIWAYGKRIWKRLPDIKAQAKGQTAIYDADTVEKMTNVGDKEGEPSLQRANQDVAPQMELTAEKELWEVLLLVDLEVLFDTYGQEPLKDKTLSGPRWYLCTVQVDQNLLLRIQHDDMERSRFVLMILFPRPDRATEGFSLIGHKLITIIEEHTAWRNMAADRGSMLIQAPIKRLIGALWDPLEQPWGPKAVIDVRDMRELDVVQVSSEGMSEAFEHIQMVERNAERVVGVNDIASGQVLEQNKTLGEVQMATAAAEVRMDLVIRRGQEALEDLAQIRHAIWKRVLAEQPDGVQAPQSLMVGLEGRGVSITDTMPTGRITADMLEGSFRFRPRGSVENADLNRLRNDFVGAMQALPMLLQAFPMLQQSFRSMAAGRAMGRQFLRVFRMPNVQAFLGSPSQDMYQVAVPPPLPPMLPGAVPGQPTAPGSPGMPGPPPTPGAAPPGPPQPSVVHHVHHQAPPMPPVPGRPM